MDYHEYVAEQRARTRQYELEQAEKVEEEHRRYRQAGDAKDIERVETMNARELAFFVYGEPKLNDDPGLAAHRAAVIDALTPRDPMAINPTQRERVMRDHRTQVGRARETLTNRLCHKGGDPPAQEHALMRLWQLFETATKGAWDGQYPSVQHKEGLWTTPAIAQ